jgi:hypothetical protein
MLDNRGGTLALIAAQVARWFSPVRDQFANGLALDLFAELGTQFPPELLTNSSFKAATANAGTALGSLTGRVDELLSAVEAQNFAQTLQKLDALRSAIQAATTALSGIASALAGVGGSLPGFSATEVNAFASGLGQRLFEWSVITHVETVTPEIAVLLDLFGVLERSEQQVGSTDPKHPQFTSKALHLDKLPRALTSPFGALRDLYGFGEPTFDGVALFARVASALSYAGLPALNEPSAAPPKVDLVFAELSRDTTVSPPGLALTLKTQFNETFQVQRPPLTLTGVAKLAVPPGTTLTLGPNLNLGLRSTSSATVQGELSFSAKVAELDSTQSIVLVGEATGSRLELRSFALGVGGSLTWQPSTAVATGTFAVELDLGQVHLLLQAPGGDGFLSTILPGGSFDSTFDLGFSLGSSGFTLKGGGALELVLPLNLSIGPATVDAVHIGVRLKDGALSVPLAANIRASLGPVNVLVENLGIVADFAFPGSGGNLGPLDVGIEPQLPTGLGVSLDTGGVSGGGFLTFGEGRYAGAVELSVFGVSVKAFGLVETKLPDGTAGFSFVIVIIAEFTPIQLGFGFTLLGVGGLVGVNRSINEQALGDGVRTGSLEHLLFPQNVIQDAPAIINDLATVFPAAKGHFIVGPMAKLGWGTPTLISAEVGIMLEFPGPRLALLGLVRMVLPSADAAILRLQMAIAGLLDFPAKKVSVDASLFDSTVAGFVVTADMAYRMQFGNSASFLLSVGGFNPGFQPPPPFPTLRRASVDFGINGNPSLVASGYFALTSNTAQIGASIQLHASGFGIHLDGWLGFDVLFVFSPFSFTASISAGVRVSFHGVGFGITLHGSLSGPSPWHLNGKVCVSVLWWDACLPVDVTFGNNQPASLPEMDPWLGNNDLSVTGLADAIGDARNWAGSALPSEFTVVTLADASTADRTPIDPLGAATLRQKVVPLNRKLEKFGQYKPSGHSQFSLGAGMGTVLLNNQPVTEIEVVEDEFAPDHFMNLTNEQKLSLPSYEPMDAGISVAPNRTALGSSESRVLDYVTKYIDAEGTVHDNQPRHRLTQAQLEGLLTRSAAALGGIRQAGAEKYILAGRPKKVQLGPRAFVVADACTLVKNASITGTEISQSQAILALNNHVSLNPQDLGRFAVIPAYSARAA